MENTDLTSEEISGAIRDMINWLGNLEKELNKLETSATSAQLEAAVMKAGPLPDRGLDGQTAFGMYPSASGRGCRVMDSAWPKQSDGQIASGMYPSASGRGCRVMESAWAKQPDEAQ